MNKIHHNTVKKASKLGIELSVMENDVVATKDGVTLASGPQGNVVLDQAIARMNGKLSGTPGSRAKLKEAFKNGARKAAAAKPQYVSEDDDELSDEEADQMAADREEDDVDLDDRGNSIVKRKYKAMYRPHNYTCGDELAQMIKSHLTVATKDGKEALDMVALKRFAIANDCWQDRYALLNPGQARMNVGNRLRAKVKHGHTIKWA